LIDIEEYSARHRDDTIRARLRADLRHMVTTALRNSAINDTQYETQTIGDGLLVTINASVGKPRILGGVMDHLAADLQDYNRAAEAAKRLRVRSVLHAAEVLIDADGPQGLGKVPECRVHGLVMPRRTGPG
jgi:hypothetical protein